MKYYSQYGEENIINSFFKMKTNGLVVDVGAANGIINSNSRFLIESLNWSAILIEPNTAYFKEIENLYSNNEDVKYKNIAIHIESGRSPFYMYGNNSEECAQVSTLSNDFKNGVISIYGDKYEGNSIEIDTLTLSELFDFYQISKLDFLSIDCEGNDMNVLMSNDWSNKIRPELICVEHSMDISDLDDFMSSNLYKLYSRTIGNSFYVQDK